MKEKYKNWWKQPQKMVYEKWNLVQREKKLQEKQRESALFRTYTFF